MTIRQPMKMNFLWIGVLAVGFSAVSCKRDKVIPQSNTKAVIGSEWFKPVSDVKNTWVELDNLDSGKFKYFRTEMDGVDITQDVIDNSVILVYARLFGYDQSVWPEDYVGLLPTAIYISSAQNSEDRWSIAISPGKISIRLENSQGVYPHGGPDAQHTFRYIIVQRPSPVNGYKPIANNPLAQYSEQELRSMPYQELCRVAGLSM